VADKPGVLHAVAGVLGDHDVSIRLMEQVGLGAEARLVIILHPSLERDVQACLRDLRHLDVVDRTSGLLRVIASPL
jgi:homoserine dehydrogenase